MNAPAATSPHPSRAAREASGSRRLRAALFGVQGFTLGYLLPGPLGLPTLAHDPLSGRWLLVNGLTGVQMRYFSDVLTACLAGLAAAALGSLRPLAPGDAAVSTAATLALVALAVLFYASKVWWS